MQKAAKHVTRIIALIAIPCFVPTPTRADEPLIAVEILGLPMGIRNIGMGMTGVADVSFSANAYFNPSSIAWLDGAALSYGYHDIFEDFGLDMIASDWRATLGYRWDSLRIGGVLGYTDLSTKGTFRTIFRPEGFYAELRDYYLSYGVAFGWDRGGKCLAGGVTAKYLMLDGLEDDGLEDNVDSWVLDFGFTGAVTIDANGTMIRPRLGIAVTNKDTGLSVGEEEYDIAGDTVLGAGMDFGVPTKEFAGRAVSVIGASADIDYHDPEADEHYWALGWELSILELIQARAGFQWHDERDYNVHTLGAGIGWGIGRWTVRLDYAHFVPHPDYFDIDLDRDVFGGMVGARF